VTPKQRWTKNCTKIAPVLTEVERDAYGNPGGIRTPPARCAAANERKGRLPGLSAPDRTRQISAEEETTTSLVLVISRSCGRDGLFWCSVAGAMGVTYHRLGHVLRRKVALKYRGTEGTRSSQLLAL